MAYTARGSMERVTCGARDVRGRDVGETIAFMWARQEFGASGRRAWAAGGDASGPLALTGMVGVFSSENFWLLATIVFLFVFGKNCLIMDYLGLKDSSYDFSVNCVISFFFVYI